MTAVGKSALAQLIVSLLLAWGALLLNWGLDSRDIPQLWPAVGVLLVSFWAGWGFTALFNRRAELLMMPLSSALISIGWLEIVRYYVSKAQLDVPMREAWHAAAGVGAFIFVALLLRDYRVLEGYKYLVLLVGVLFQFSLVLIGSESHGARLWITVGSTGVQPFEFVKILIAVFLAAYLRQFSKWIRLGIISPKAGRLPRRALLVLGVCIGTAEGLLVLQKDLGMALLLFGLFTALFYIATGRKDLVAAGAVLTSAGAYVCYRYFDHVQTRVEVWLDPFKDPMNKGFQMFQGLYQLAAGGLDGTGLGLGMPYCTPDGDSDFIFNTIGEELGLIGLTAVILIIICLCSRAFRIALLANDGFGTILAAGLAVLWAWQSLIVMWGCTKMMPMTGVTLPFVSRGGSSLVANYIMMAILWRISWPEEK